ncbi:MAG: ABC transporter ATP-binding protein [Oscillospiraceae bacterium]
MIIETKSLDFSYPDGFQALNGVNISIPEGSLVSLCGCSGSGKSTLLRLIKPALSPRGELHGEIFYDNAPLSELSELRAAQEIGYVMQNTEAQLVSDRVWHELAFGLESIGAPQGEIRRRVSEMADFFGLAQVFDSDTAKLSGGQKQLLCLASACVLQPRVLLLDEPTSQLDPIAAQNFIDTLRRLNRDFGITIVIAEHRLEELLPISDRVIVLERGSVIADCEPRRLLSELPEGHAMRGVLPAAMRAFEMLGKKGEAPLTIREGKALVRSLAVKSRNIERTTETHGEPILSANELWFGYKRGGDVIRGASLKIYSGEILAVIGGNAGGKSTLLKLLAGFEKQQSGRIAHSKELRIELLPQQPAALFSKDTVIEELSAQSGGETAEAAERFGLAELLNKNPLDLSGGEQQRLALAVVLQRKPDLLLLDEPTKGMDAHAKRMLIEVLRRIAANGASAVVVTHDAELAAECADECALLFRGEIVSRAAPREFFADGCFYTTAFSRLTRGFVQGVYSAETFAEILK